MKKHSCKKKILHITEVTSGGVLPVIANICNGLVSDFDIAVAYGVRFDTPENLRDYFDARVDLFPVKSFTREVSVKKDMKALAEIRKIVKLYQPDVIHMHSTKAGLLGRIGLLFYSCKKYYTPHGYCFLKMDDSKIKRIIYKMTEKILSCMRCTTIACGRGEWKYAMQINSRSICICNGIDVERIEALAMQTKVKSHNFTVYTVGRIAPAKNAELFNKIAEKCPEISFVWIGDGEDKKYLTSSNIIVTGLLDRDKVIEMAGNCDCYISCSLWEGLPIALMEAMCMGKECIVSNVIGNNDLIEDKVNGLIADTDESYVELIEYVKGHGSTYGEKAKETIVREYSLNRMCEEYKLLIQGM